MPRDTSPEAYRIQVEVLSRLTGPERLLLALEFSDLVIEFHKAGKAARAARAGTDVENEEEE